MNKSVVHKLNFAKKLLLGAVGVMAFGLPIVFGLAKPAKSQPQSPSKDMAPKMFVFTRGYQHVSVTRGEPGNGTIQTRINFTPDSFKAKNQTLQELLKLAYGVLDNQISGGPDWITTARFNVEASLDSSTVSELKNLSSQQQKMERDQMLCGLTSLAIEPGLIGEIEQEARRERADTQDIYLTPLTRLITAPSALEVLQEASRFSW